MLAKNPKRWREYSAPSAEVQPANLTPDGVIRRGLRNLVLGGAEFTEGRRISKIATRMEGCSQRK